MLQKEPWADTRRQIPTNPPLLLTRFEDTPNCTVSRTLGLYRLASHGTQSAGINATLEPKKKTLQANSEILIKRREKRAPHPRGRSCTNQALGSNVGIVQV